jgi:hypothetical protein
MMETEIAVKNLKSRTTTMKNKAAPAVKAQIGRRCFKVHHPNLYDV